VSSDMGRCTDTIVVDSRLAVNTSQLEKAAQEALSFITSHIFSHRTSLKVQTSKGNYLTSVSS